VGPIAGLDDVEREKSLLCMYKGWAIKLALAPRPLMIYCSSPLAAAMIITVAALRIEKSLARAGNRTPLYRLSYRGFKRSLYVAQYGSLFQEAETKG
jgi:hypothetical protein